MRVPKLTRQLAITAALASVAACAPNYVKPLPAVPVPPPPSNVAPRTPVVTSLTSVLTAVPFGSTVGQLSYGFFGGTRCAHTLPFTYKQQSDRLQITGFQAVFGQVMSQAGVPVQATTQRFEGEEVRRADLQVSATIKDLVINVCYPEIRDDNEHVRGEAYVSIEWSVFSPVERTVRYTATTEGRTYEEVESRLGYFGVLQEAFRNALLNLMTKSDFRDVLVESRGVAVPNAVSTAMTRAPLMKGRITDNLESIRQGVVTILANSGEGSGFAVGSGDHIVTAAHVVSGSKFVKVVGAKGEALYGEVVRKDAKRDLALVRLDRAAFRALGLADAVPSEGAEIYAIGSPLGKDFAFSVTKGVVSATRKVGTQRYIQSDVTVMPGSSGGPLLDAQGNVIGITVDGIGVDAGGTVIPVGMNFFIPAPDVDHFLRSGDSPQVGR